MRKQMSARQLYAFGYGRDGQLCHRLATDGDDGSFVKTPRMIIGAPTGPSGVTVKAVASGEKHTLLLADDGKVGKLIT